MTMFSSKVQNLFREYPDEFLREYRGCIDLDCVPGCNISNAHCERIAVAFAKWQADNLTDSSGVRNSTASSPGGSAPAQRLPE